MNAHDILQSFGNWIEIRDTVFEFLKSKGYVRDRSMYYQKPIEGSSNTIKARYNEEGELTLFVEVLDRLNDVIVSHSVSFSLHNDVSNLKYLELQGAENALSQVILKLESK